MEWVKVYFEIQPGNIGEGGTESMNCAHIRDDVLRVDNIPAFFSGLAFGDLIRVGMGEEGELVFHSVVERSGHSTFWIYRNVGVEKSRFEENVKAMEGFKCGMEWVSEVQVAVDVPPDAVLEHVYRYLTILEERGVWYFVMACRGKSAYSGD